MNIKQDGISPNAGRLLWAGFMAILAAGVGFGIRGAIFSDWVKAFNFTGLETGLINGAGFTGFCFGIVIGGVIVDRVLGNTPASRAGLRGNSRPIQTKFGSVCPDAAGGDFITSVDGQPVTTFDDILIYLARYTSPGDTITLNVIRDGKNVDLPLTLAPRPN